jgi:hypothetical protein
MTTYLYHFGQPDSQHSDTTQLTVPRGISHLISSPPQRFHVWHWSLGTPLLKDGSTNLAVRTCCPRLFSENHAGLLNKRSIHPLFYSGCTSSELEDLLLAIREKTGATSSANEPGLSKFSLVQPFTDSQK